MLSMLIAYDASGNVIATLDYMTVLNDDGDAVGLVDFEVHEDAGNNLTDVWQVSGAVGSGTWPEWIGGRAHDFKVERSGGKITALVHKTSGRRRERAAIQASINNRIEAAAGGPADIRDIVGGPDRPLNIDAEGRTQPRITTTRPVLPMVSNLSRR